MTVLALKLSRAANGVSELHGEVSRQMWQALYPGVPVEQVPIGHITNGIHLLGWMKGPVRSSGAKNSPTAALATPTCSATSSAAIGRTR
jgi:glucan phosphorylase